MFDGINLKLNNLIINIKGIQLFSEEKVDTLKYKNSLLH